MRTHLRDEYIAIGATVPKMEGLHAHRIVLRYFPDTAQPYVVHLNVIPESGTSFYVHGYYFSKVSKALACFAEKCANRITMIEAHNDNEVKDD